MPATRSAKKTVSSTPASEPPLSVDDFVGQPVAGEEAPVAPTPPVSAVAPAEDVPMSPAKSAEPTPFVPKFDTNTLDRPTQSRSFGSVHSEQGRTAQDKSFGGVQDKSGSAPIPMMNRMPMRRPMQPIAPRAPMVPQVFNRPMPPAQTSTYRPMRSFRDQYASGNQQMQDANVPTETVTGFLDVTLEGHGFLRPKFVPSDRDIYISQSQIRKFNLRGGDAVTGQARQPKDNERYWGLLKVEKINGAEADTMSNRPRFDDLVPIYPKQMIKLEHGKEPVSCRIIDLFAPIGFGQRGLIVSPPKAGKTTILKQIANGITANFPDCHLMAVLIGERPEEVTDLSRSIKGEVIASHFDESPPDQTRVAEIGLERAKRLVEMGKDVVILLDSITRLARAYNLTVNSSGRTLSGGFDPAALHPAKRFLGAARKIEEGGSLTIIGTALVETGSRMDDLIYEEFKGTGNMELHLSRSLAERRVFPAIDIERSGTRQEHLLFTEEKMKKIVTLRNMLLLLGDSAERTMALVERMGKTTSNDDFLQTLSQGS